MLLQRERLVLNLVIGLGIVLVGDLAITTWLDDRSDAL